MNDVDSGQAAKPPLWRKFVPVLMLFLAIGMAAMMISLRPEPSSEPPSERITYVDVVPLHRADVQVVVNSQGLVEAGVSTNVVAEVSGVLVEVSDELVAGAFVQQGDVLAVIDRADYEVQVEQARANLTSAEAQLMQEQAQADQAGREWDLSGRPRSEAPLLALRAPWLREAEARVALAQAELERAQRQLERTRIRAPYDAIIRERLADLGQFVSTGSQIAGLFSTEFAEVRLPLSDQDIAWLDLPAPGSTEGALTVSLKGNVSGKMQHWQGQMVRTEGTIDQNSRMQYGVVRIEDPYARQRSNGNPLLVGSFLQAGIEGARLEQVFEVPLASVYRGNEVLVMDAEHRLRRREVNILRSDDQYAYIDTGLQTSDRLIVSPIQVPVDGMRVEPVQVSL